VAVLGATIRQMRKERRLTQGQLGALAELHANYIGLVERGERNLSARNLCRIAAALHVLPTDLWKEVSAADLRTLRSKALKHRERRMAEPERRHVP